VARNLIIETVGGKRKFHVNKGQRTAILDAACVGCCASVYIRPRLCPSPGGTLSGDTGAADISAPIGLQVSALDAAGSFFCFNGRCYYVTDPADYWDVSAVPGTDFRVVSQGEWDSVTQYDECDHCPCTFIGRTGASYSSDATADFSVDLTTSGTGTLHDESHNPQSTVAFSGTLSASNPAPLPFTGRNCAGGVRVPFFAGPINVVRHFEWTITRISDGVVTDSGGYDATTSEDLTISLADDGGAVQFTAFRAPTLDNTLGTTTIVPAWAGGSPPYNGVVDGTCAGAAFSESYSLTTPYIGSDTIEEVADVDMTITVNGNTCPCDAAVHLYRKLEYVWDCDDATGTMRVLWQRCMTGAVTHDWQDEADVQCTIRGGRRVKVFTKIEDLGTCPDPLPDPTASLPSPPTVTDCTDCPDGSKCLWRFIAQYVSGSWSIISRTLVGCRRTKDYPAWTYVSPCKRAIDLFGESCAVPGDCGATPPADPALPGSAPSETCPALTCRKRITYQSEWSCEFATWNGEEGDQIPQYVPDSGVCVDGGTAAHDWEITSFDPGTDDPIATIETFIGECDCANVGDPITPTFDEINDNRPGDPPFSAADLCP
jgi:hypothetical protein